MSESSAVKKYVAELIGTLVLVLMGCGSAVLAGRNFGGLAGIGAVGISFAFGISVLAMAYAIGGISGCHIPTYSLSLNGLGQNGFGAASPAGYSMMSAFIAEVVLTFIFLLVILGSTSEKAPKGFAGISIGLSLVLIHLVGIPVTGTSVNPARSLGPAVIMSMANSTALNQLWLFWVAPIIGGLIAAVVWRILK